MSLALTLVIAAAPVAVLPVPDALRARDHLSAHYVKYVDAGGLPVVGSARVADAALREARSLVRAMLVNHPEYLKTIGEQGVRLAVMAPTELTTDLPEHADLKPKDYWDRRARGLGASPPRPAVSCAEENLLEEPGDPYAAENICIHEFAHTLHQFALVRHVPRFEQRLHAAFEHAREQGIWRGTYAMSYETEYWAEAVQSWFDTNRHDDDQHGPIDTREEVQAADPLIAALIQDALGDVPWRYRRPSRRSAAERAELGAFPDPLPRFAWPAIPVSAGPEQALALAASSPPPARSPSSSEAAVVSVENAGAEALAWDWVSADGALRHYATIAPGGTLDQQTYAGHVWVVSRAGRRLGWLTAPRGHGRLVVR